LLPPWKSRFVAQEIIVTVKHPARALTYSCRWPNMPCLNTITARDAFTTRGTYG
jgi:hypothetical protein